MSYTLLFATRKDTGKKEYWTGFAYNTPSDILRQWKAMEPDYKSYEGVSVVIKFRDEEVE